jgi:O-antigen ligase
VSPARRGGAPRDPLAAGGGIAFLLLVASLAGPIAPMGIATALCGALTLAGLARPREPARTGERPAWPRTPVDRAGLAWLAALVLASAFAVDPAGSFPRVTKGLMPALVGLAAFHAAAAGAGRRALAVYLVATGLASAWSLVVWAGEGASGAWRARGLSHHYMTYGGQLLLELPVALSLALTARSPRWRWGAGAVAALAALSLATTFTRSAWLGAFVAGAVVVTALRPWGLALLVAGGAAAWLFAAGEWRERLHSMVDPRHGYNGERLLMWGAGLRMFLADPLTGVGLQDMRAVYPQYRSPLATEEVGHLHNTVVQIGASMGLAGLAAFAWLYASLVRAAAGGLRLARDLPARLRSGGEPAGLRLGVVAALAGFLVAGVFEWNFGDEELLYHLYTLVGLAWASRVWDAPRPAA